MKKCPFCAEEIQNEAVKCKHCGELLSRKPKTDIFAKYEDWLKQNYPDYVIVSRNADEKYIILNREYKPFSGCLLIVLLFLFVIPAIIYFIWAMMSKRVLSVTIYFDDNGLPIKTDRSNYEFLIKNYSQSFEK